MLLIQLCCIRVGLISTFFQIYSSKSRQKMLVSKNSQRNPIHARSTLCKLMGTDGACVPHGPTTPPHMPHQRVQQPSSTFDSRAVALRGATFSLVASNGRRSRERQERCSCGVRLQRLEFGIGCALTGNDGNNIFINPTPCAVGYSLHADCRMWRLRGQGFRGSRPLGRTDVSSSCSPSGTLPAVTPALI